MTTLASCSSTVHVESKQIHNIDLFIHHLLWLLVLILLHPCQNWYFHGKFFNFGIFWIGPIPSGKYYCTSWCIWVCLCVWLFCVCKYTYMCIHMSTMYACIHVWWCIGNSSVVRFLLHLFPTFRKVKNWFFQPSFRFHLCKMNPQKKGSCTREWRTHWQKSGRETIKRGFWLWHLTGMLWIHSL